VATPGVVLAITEGKFINRTNPATFDSGRATASNAARLGFIYPIPADPAWCEPKARFGASLEGNSGACRKAAQLI
jgi:hypothetical protein